MCQRLKNGKVALVVNNFCFATYNWNDVFYCMCPSLLIQNSWDFFVCKKLLLSQKILFFNGLMGVLSGHHLWKGGQNQTIWTMLRKFTSWNPETKEQFFKALNSKSDDRSPLFHELMWVSGGNYSWKGGQTIWTRLRHQFTSWSLEKTFLSFKL